jgi:predicted DNA-binding protein (MmcQ/YjbR family)
MTGMTATKKTVNEAATKVTKKVTKKATKRAAKNTAATSRAAAELRKFALGFPGAHEEFPWGERVVKVRGKVFVFLGHDTDDGVGLSVKLPSSGMMALAFPFAEPTGYGLGKSGWVSASFGPRDAVPLPMLRDWITESYRAVAPKKLAQELDGTAPTAAATTNAALASKRRRQGSSRA